MAAGLSLICPLCHASLPRTGTTWRCSAGHAFDVAREGYVNLLPVQQRRSRAPGDSPEMIRARREFLDAGHYAPLRDALAATLAPLRTTTAVDLGCGEGYYSRAIKDGLSPGGELAGLDISREAIRQAARRHPDITWLVGSSAAVPLATAGCELVTCLFAPLLPAEMARVLVPGGTLLLVVPGERHLQALREALFDEVREHRPDKVLDALQADFRLCERRELTFPLQLANADLRRLLQMTPYAWRAQPQRGAALAAREDFVAEASFVLFRLARNGG